MGQALVTLPDGRKARVTYDTPEQLDAAVNDLVGAPKTQGELPSDKYAREHGITLPIDSGGNTMRQYGTEAVRAVGAAGADVAKGALALPAEILDAPETVFNAGAQLLGSNVRAPRLFHEAVSAIPRPEPRNATERVVRDVGQGVSGAVSGAAAGSMMANAADALTSAVGQQLAARPTLQAVSGATGAAAGGITREQGGGPGSQFVASLLGAIAPSLLESAGQGLVRQAYRGGEDGQRAMRQNIEAFNDVGTTPTVGQATQNRFAQSTESLLSKTPGSAGSIAAKAETQAKEIGAGLEQTAADLAPKASGEQAGRAITRGISGQGGFVENFKAQQNALYDKLDNFIKPTDRVDVSNTKAALESLNAEIPGAPNVSKFFQNSKIKGIQGAMQADTEGMSSIAANPDYADAFAGKTVSPEDAALLKDFLVDGKLPYEALKKLRTLVGGEIADAGLASDVPRSKWKALYGALSSDLESAADAAGPNAKQAWTRANNYTRAGMQRLDTLDSVVAKNGGPEAVFRAATSGTKEGATTLRAVMQSLPEDAQKTISATIIRRLGTAKAGVQNELGDKFSTETFLTNWNTLSPQAKAVLFDRFGADFRQNMDQVAKVAANLRSGSKVFANPPGTAASAAQFGTVGAFVMAALTGQVKTATAIAGAAGGANLISRLFTNPRFVNWLATSTKAPTTAIPAAINSLAQQGKKSGDQDLIAAANLLTQNPGNQQKQP